VQINLLILQLAVIFLPGIIWARLDAGFAAKVKPSDIEFFLRAFLFGLAAYAVEFLLFTAFGWRFTMADLGNAATREIVSKDVAFEIAAALAIGLFLSVVWLYGSRNKWLPRLLLKIGATTRFGDEDVWDFTFNSADIYTEYVHFRDFEHQLVYAGLVDTFSETGKLRELVLRDVIVYNFEGEEMYRTPRLYLARAPENIHIEFPRGEPEENADDQS
jgi:hypothetical protein